MPGTTTTIPFYYDQGPTGIPTGLTLANFTLTSISPGATAVSGVYVLSGTPTYSLTTTVANMGNYFYRSPILSYTFTPGGIIRESTLSNASSGLTAGNTQLSGNLIITRAGATGITGLPALTAASYTESIGLGVTAANLFGSTTSAISSIFAIVDPTSVSLKNITTIAIPAGNPGTTLQGAHVTSGDPANYFTYTGISGGLPMLGTGATGYAPALYNHTVDISAGAYSSELQLARGVFCAPGSGFGYRNYVGSSYAAGSTNNVNYLGAPFSSSYRYSTFAWSLQGITSPITPPIYFVINFLNLKSTIGTNPSGISQITDSSDYNVNIFYMFIDSANNNPSADDSTVLTSTWINASALETPASPPVLTGNFNNTTTYKVYSALQPSQVSYAGGILTLPTLWPTIKPNSKNVILYLRIGLHQSSPATFSNVRVFYRA
jgi:hypothetical protein